MRKYFNISIIPLFHFFNDIFHVRLVLSYSSSSSSVSIYLCNTINDGLRSSPDCPFQKGKSQLLQFTYLQPVHSFLCAVFVFELYLIASLDNAIGTKGQGLAISRDPASIRGLGEGISSFRKRLYWH